MTDKPDLDPEKEIAAASTADFPLHTVYFYYLKYDAAGETIRVYTHFDRHTPVGNIRDRSATLAANAIIDGNNPLKDGTKFDDIERKLKGYFVIALDGAYFTSRNPVKFYCDDASNPSSIGNDGKHTFFYQGRFTKTIEGTPISFAIYRSLAKSRRFLDDLGNNEREHFKIKVHGTLGRPVGPRTILYDDSGGTNMGPPPGPPFVPPVPHA